MASFAKAVTKKTKIVAAGYASNAVGTINDVKTIVDMAHAAGALAYIDAVQFAPHGPIDVLDLGCDFLACSAYKFFGPHEGILYGRLDLLDGLEAYKVRPATNEPPGKFETGTQNHEGIAGTLAAVEYLAQVAGLDAARTSRRQRVAAAMAVIKEYEKTLSARLTAGLQQIKGVKVWGITDRRSWIGACPPSRSQWQAAPRARSPSTWASAASSSGTATTTPCPSWRSSACSRRAAWCAWGWRTITPWARSRGCLRHWQTCRRPATFLKERSP